MRGIFERLLSQVKEIWNKLDPKKRIFILAGAGASILLVILIVVLSASAAKPKGWMILFKNLDPQDLAMVTKYLDQWKEPYKIEGNTILVRPKRVDILRIKLAGAGALPKRDRGWQLFDEQKWSLSRFRDKVLFRRALQGAIAQTIKALEPVEDADVLIALPEPELYVEEEKPVTASIRVTLKPFTELKPDQIKGIVNLVAFAVEGLSPDNITIVDQYGRVLTDLIKEKRFTLGEEAEELLKIRRKEEMKLEQKIRKRLKEILGEDKAEVLVRLDLSFDKEKSKIKRVEPITVKKGTGKFAEVEVYEGLTVSEEKEKEKFEGKGVPPEGPPGVEPNLPAYKEVVEKGPVKYEREKTIVNREISQTTTEVEKAPIKINKISVSVFVDGHWEKKIVKGKIIRKYIPRKKEELRKIEELVKAAIGYDPMRGDMVVVRNVMFNREKEWKKEEEELRRRRQLQTTILATLTSLIFLAIALLVTREIARQIRIRRAQLARERERRRREEILRAAEEEQRRGIISELTLAEKAKGDLLEQVLAVARERPKDVAQVIRNWMLEE